MNRFLPVTVAAALMAALLSGCADDGAGPGSISLYLQGDAATLGNRFDEVELLIGEAQLLWDGEPGGGGYASGATGGWRVLQGGPALRIGGGGEDPTQALFMGELDAEAGVYTMVRFLDVEGTGTKARDEERRLAMEGARADLFVEGVQVEPGKETRLVIRVGLDSWFRDPGRNTWQARVFIQDVQVSVLDDAASGTDVHDPGDLVTVA
ncbi:MAG: hypothetical protein ACPGQL_07160 [Thermoplasmatota archaeon]